MKVLNKEVVEIWEKINDLEEDLKKNTTKEGRKEIKMLLEVANVAISSIMKIENGEE